MSVNVSMMENKVAQSFSGVKKIQTNLTDGSTQNWVPENEANEYIKTKSFSTSKNGEYYAENEGVDAFSEVKVNVADPQYRLGQKEVKQNGIYQASADGLDAYSEVKVEVDVPTVMCGDYTLSWELISNTGYGTGNPYNFVELNGLVYIYNSNREFKSFNGMSWTTLQSIPVTSVFFITAYNNQIHAFYNRDHYVWNGISWTKITTQNPYNIISGRTCAFEEQGVLHLLVDSGHYIWDGVSWSQSSVVPSTTGTSYGRCSYKINDTNHVIIDRDDFEYKNNVFKKVARWAEGYSVGKFKVYEIEKVVGQVYLDVQTYQAISFNGMFTRWEENPMGSYVRNFAGSFTSILDTLYFIGQTYVYKANVIEQT